MDRIGKESQDCLRLLNEAAALEHLGPAQQSTIADSVGRFKLWAGNIGALQQGRSSLDARLGKSRISQEVLNLLEELKETLQYLINPSEVLDDSDESGDEDFFADFTESVCMCITNLLKLSTLIRHNPSRDPWKRILTLPLWDPRPMMDNARQKWPKLNSNEDLTHRLGSANSRRRQFFRYREEHVQKQSKPLRDDDKTLPETMPTTFVSGEEGNMKVHPAEHSIEVAVEDNASETTFATTFGQDIESEMTIPPPPPGYDKGGLVECSLCKSIVSVPTKRAWKKHVYRDLRPYVCTFQDCGFKVFDKRRDWFQHELEEHRARMSCPICSNKYEGKRALEDHVSKVHGDKVQESQLANLSSKALKAVETLTASLCPFCDDWGSELIQKYQKIPNTDFKVISGSPVVSEKQLCKHVARHMEQLSLFALPKSYEDDGISASASDESQESEISLDNDDYDMLKNFIEREDEAKYRCLVPDCREVFANEAYWRQHVGKRHGEWVEMLRKEVPKPPAESSAERNRLEELMAERITQEAMDVSEIDQQNIPESRGADSGSISKPKTANLRIWNDRTGVFKVNGEFLALENGKIHIHKINGVKIAVSVHRMSVTDLEYVETVTGQSLENEKLLSRGMEVPNPTSDSAHFKGPPHRGAVDRRALVEIHPSEPLPKFHSLPKGTDIIIDESQPRQPPWTLHDLDPRHHLVAGFDDISFEAQLSLKVEKNYCPFDVQGNPVLTKNVLNQEGRTRRMRHVFKDDKLWRDPVQNGVRLDDPKKDREIEGDTEKIALEREFVERVQEYKSGPPVGEQAEASSQQEQTRFKEKDPLDRATWNELLDREIRKDVGARILNAALDRANQAVRFHDAQQYEEAKQAYDDALSQLSTALASARVEGNNKEIAMTIESYIQRIRRLRENVRGASDERAVDSREARPDNPQRASGATSLGIDQLHEKSAEARADTASRIRSLIQSAENEDHRRKLAAILDAYEPQSIDRTATAFTNALPPSQLDSSSLHNHMLENQGATRPASNEIPRLEGVLSLPQAPVTQNVGELKEIPWEREGTQPEDGSYLRMVMPGEGDNLSKRLADPTASRRDEDSSTWAGNDNIAEDPEDPEVLQDKQEAALATAREQCRICELEHSTSQCPFKATMAPEREPRKTKRSTTPVGGSSKGSSGAEKAEEFALAEMRAAHELKSSELDRVKKELEALRASRDAAPQSQPKRSLANRTKIGCLTCRERIKQCDEGKPSCNNCKQDGFVCKGYSSASTAQLDTSPRPVFKPVPLPAAQASLPYTIAASPSFSLEDKRVPLSSAWLINNKPCPRWQCSGKQAFAQFDDDGKTITYECNECQAQWSESRPTSMEPSAASEEPVPRLVSHMSSAESGQDIYVKRERSDRGSGSSDDLLQYEDNRARASEERAGSVQSKGEAVKPSEEALEAYREALQDVSEQEFYERAVRDVGKAGHVDNMVKYLQERGLRGRKLGRHTPTLDGQAHPNEVPETEPPDRSNDFQSVLSSYEARIALDKQREAAASLYPEWEDDYGDIFELPGDVLTESRGAGILDYLGGKIRTASNIAGAWQTRSDDSNEQPPVESKSVVETPEVSARQSDEPGSRIRPASVEEMQRKMFTKRQHHDVPSQQDDASTRLPVELDATEPQILREGDGERGSSSRVAHYQQPATWTSDRAKSETKMSPRDVRRQMLAQELDAPLRQALLWERKQRDPYFNIHNEDSGYYAEDRHHEAPAENPSTQKDHVSTRDHVLSTRALKLPKESSIPVKTGQSQGSKPQCWDHGCNGREFSTFSDLLHHQREWVKTNPGSHCPRCGAQFTDSIVRTNHILYAKCASREDQKDPERGASAGSPEGEL